ncbi:unnamed protein product [Lampetra planeri]
MPPATEAGQAGGLRRARSAASVAVSPGASGLVSAGSERSAYGGGGRRRESGATASNGHRHPGQQQQQRQQQQHGESGGESGPCSFYVNRGGFPLDEATWERLWRHVAGAHPAGGDAGRGIRGEAALAQPPVPAVPTFRPSMPIPERLLAVQNYMRELQYNHTGTQFFEIRKSRPLVGLMDSAREMVQESLPIKCLEAVILGIHLTNGIPGVERFPLSFKSQFGGRTFRHVVLGVYHNGRFGSLGMSRRPDLMHKPLTFRSLYDLIADFQEAYRGYLHTVTRIKVGLSVPHDSQSFETIAWDHLTLNTLRTSAAETRSRLERHSRDIRCKLRKSLFGVPSPPRDRRRGKSVSPHRGLSSALGRPGRDDGLCTPGGRKSALPVTLTESGYQIRV